MYTEKDLREAFKAGYNYIQENKFEGAENEYIQTVKDRESNYLKTLSEAGSNRYKDIFAE